MQPMTCLLIGEGSLLIQCAEILLRESHKVSGLISPDSLNQDWASEHEIPWAASHDSIQQLGSGRGVDHLFSIVNNSVLPKDVLDLARYGAINYHDGPLPRYAGRYVTSWAILNGETTHGVSWHLMNEEVDAGDILKQELLPVLPADNAFVLNGRCYEAAIRSFGELVRDLAQGRRGGRKQDLTQRTYFPKTKRPEGACIIDWHRPARDIDALVRALDFGPAANPLGLPKTLVREEAVAVRAVSILTTESELTPGTIVSASDDRLTVATRTYDVEIRELASLDGRSLHIGDFISRNRLDSGSRLLSLDEAMTARVTNINEAVAAHDAYWLQKLARLDAVSFPLLKLGASASGQPKSLTVPFPHGMAWRPDKLGWLVAALGAYLTRMGGETHFEVRFANRCAPIGTEDLPQLYAEYVPLRFEVSREAKVVDVVKATEKELENARRRISFPLDILGRFPQLRSQPSLEDVLPITLELLPDTRSYSVKSGAGLTIALFEDSGDSRWTYAASILDDDAVRRMVQQVQLFIARFLSDEATPVWALPILPEAERATLLVEWNDTSKDYHEHRCLHEIIEDQARRTPEAVAVVFGGVQITYGELDRRANSLAETLQQMQIGPDILVGICMDRSVEMVVGLLGILKAGGAYVPIDPEYPTERVAFMLADSGPRVLLSQRHLVHRLPGYSGRLLCPDEWEPDGKGIGNLKAPRVRKEHLAYGIYTSGSTGKPKCALNTHEGIVNRLLWMQEAYQLTSSDRVLQKTPFSFDVSVWEFFWPLMFGARLVVARPAGHRDSSYLVEEIKKESITTMHFVPSMLQVFLEDPAVEQCTTLKRVICSGEALPYELQQRFFSRLGCELHNLYGPTEAAVDVTYWACQRDSRDRSVPIGRPISNIQMYVLDDELRPVPIGVPGELFIGGVGLARGYLNRPELTAERFIRSPFEGTPGSRLYRTGDLARYRSDGAIEYLGRLDHQVKIRGFRIELGEVESVLSEHPTVRTAVVMAREDVPGDKRLVAYVVLDQEQSTWETALRSHVAARLPEYMIPNTFMRLGSMPLSPNGKVDRKALPAPARSAPRSSVGYVPPSMELERVVAGIWSEVLKVDNVGIHDNFFEIGGHSLLLVEVQSKLRQVLHEKCSLTDLFAYPTVSALAGHLAQATDENPGQKGRKLPQRVARSDDEDASIAIIGVSCRFPGAPNASQFWRNLCDGIESITTFSDEQLRSAGIPESVLMRPNYVKRRPTLDNAEYFDAAFFGMSPRETRITDPNHRLLLECAWEALETAGYDPRSTARTGVFAGMGPCYYASRSVYANPRVVQEYSGHELMIGSLPDFLATRLSYKLNLTGPSIGVQTACSTGLVAVISACKTLLSGDCDMALAGAAHVNPYRSGYLYEEGHISSPDGHCRAFDAEARGTVLGDGVGVVVLKRLAEALADNDDIYAVIKGFGINNDGSDKVGFAAPSVQGQKNAIQAALHSARISADSVTYVEAHGTGTVRGDPIEVAALSSAFREHTKRKGFCAIGSVKTNIGHLDAAAGIAGLIKTVLAIRHQRIPPSLNFRTPNPEIDFGNSPFFVNTTLRPWQADGPRRAGVSSFGMGGTNCHVVLQEAPAAQPSVSSWPGQLLVLSAKTESALKSAAEKLGDYLKEDGGPKLADIAYTLAVGRQAFPHRCAIVCRDKDDVGAFASAQRTVVSESDARPVAFMFPGQGSQYPGMGFGLYKTFPVFRKEIERCAQMLGPLIRMDLRDAVYHDSRKVSEGGNAFERATVMNSALFAVEYATAKLWMSWGLEPAAVIGHSLGEYAAACIAGVFSLEDALSLVVTRAELLESLGAGGMLVVPLSESEVAPLLGGQLSLAAINAPSRCVVSGPNAAIARLEDDLRRRGVRVSKVQVRIAFHSMEVDPIVGSFTQAVSKVRLARPNIPYVSAVTGDWASNEVIKPEYWGQHLRQTVQFSRAMRTLLQDKSWTLVETGPGNTLSLLAEQHFDQEKSRTILVPSLRHPKDRTADVAFVLEAVGKLWGEGVRIDWNGFYREERRHRVAVPAYPFERTRHWIEPAKGESLATTQDVVGSSLAGVALHLPGKAIHHLLKVGTSFQPQFDDHLVHGARVAPGAFYIAALLAVATSRLNSESFVLQDVEFHQPLPLEEEAVNLHLVLAPDADSAHRFEIVSPGTDAGSWRSHAAGRLQVLAAPSTRPIEPLEYLRSCDKETDGSWLVELLAARGVIWGPRWLRANQVRLGQNQGMLRIDAGKAEQHPISPVVLDNVFVTGRLGFEQATDGDRALYVPFGIEELRFYGPIWGHIWTHSTIRDPKALGAETRTTDVTVFNDDGKVLLEARGLSFKRSRGEAAARSAKPSHIYEVAWRKLPPAPQVKISGPWLLISNGGNIGEKIAALLEKRGARCLHLALEDDFQKARGTIEQALASIAPEGVLMLCEEPDEAAVVQTAVRYSIAALSLAQAAVRSAVQQPPRLLFVTRGAYAVSAGDAVSAAASALIGFARVLTQEHPELRATVLDLEPGCKDTPALVEEFIAELQPGAGEPEVAVRNGQRFVPRLTRSGTGQNNSSSSCVAVHADATYLISGGLGALGLHVARWLVKQGAKNLVLMGRNAPSAEAKTIIESLCAEGAAITVAAADVANKAEVKAVLAAITDKVPLRGVVHAAGILEGSIVQDQTPSLFERVMAPKVAGGWNLHELTDKHSLDFFLLFSSSAVLFGSPGQSNYAAANAFLDGLAQLRHSKGLPALSVGWGTWSGGGFFARLDDLNRRRLAGTSFTPEQNLALLEQALGQQQPHLGVFRFDPAAFRTQTSEDVPALLRELVVSPKAPTPVDRDLSTELRQVDPQQRQTHVEGVLQQELAALLGLSGPSEITPERPLGELGLDSLMAVELRNRLSKRVGRPLPATLAYDYPTVEQQAKYVLERVLNLP